jgi:hypothetical protein
VGKTQAYCMLKYVVHVSSTRRFSGAMYLELTGFGKLKEEEDVLSRKQKSVIEFHNNIGV